ncbi:MAG TPA: hypothetical protein DDY37_06530 [Legionella sp.]|nr:hypothetical protein [Legionella sp.]
MMNDKMGLFSTLGPDATKQTKRNEIERLRAVARHYLNEHNALVNQFWALDMLSTDAMDETAKAQIELNKDQLTKRITDHAYDKMHHQAIESAKTLEMDVFGHSELNNASFYAL